MISAALLLSMLAISPLSGEGLELSVVSMRRTSEVSLMPAKAGEPPLRPAAGNEFVSFIVRAKVTVQRPVILSDDVRVVAEGGREFRCLPRDAILYPGKDAHTQWFPCEVHRGAALVAFKIGDRTLPLAGIPETPPDPPSSERRAGDQGEQRMGRIARAHINILDVNEIAKFFGVCRKSRRFPVEADLDGDGCISPADVAIMEAFLDRKRRRDADRKRQPNRG